MTLTRLSLVFFLVGLAAAVALIAWRGMDAVLAVLALGGWSVLSVAPYYGVPLVAAALAWGMLFSGQTRPRLGAVVRAEWIAHAVNSLLPAAQIGGEVVKARLVHAGGVPGAVAGATVIVDKTVQAVAQLVIVMIGLALLAAYAGPRAPLAPIIAGAAAFGVLVYVFYRLQRQGLFPFLARLAAWFAGKARLETLVGGAADLEGEIRGIYARPGAVAGACLLRLLNRWAMAGEVWIALLLLGQPVDLAQALILEFMSQAARAAAFAVPGSMGVQEGTFVAAGLAVGVSPEVALAVSLVKRGRELAVFLPALVVWELAEGRFLFRRPKV